MPDLRYLLMSQFALSVLASVLALGSIDARAADKCRPSDWKPNSKIRASLVRQSDGDTIEIRARGGTYKVRFLSVDTPETHFHGQSQGHWAEAAKERTAELLAAPGRLEIEFDATPCDIYGRLLGYVKKGGVDVNRKLVEEGLAVTFCVWTTRSRCEPYSNALDEAIRARRGFFADAAAELPYDFRTRLSGRDEAKYVGDLERPSEVLPFARRGEIPVAKRVLFLSDSDVAAPYELPR